MASHAGAIYTIKTKNGYISENNTYTDDIEKAITFGFGMFAFTDASIALQRLGFKEESASYYTVIPSYDTRECIIEDRFKLLGFKYPESCEKASYYYKRTNSNDYNDFLKGLKQLDEEVNLFYQNRPVDDKTVFNGEIIKLKKIENSEEQQFSECIISELYGMKKKITKLSYRLKKLPLEKYFDIGTDEKEIYKLYNEELLKIVRDKVTSSIYKDSKVDKDIFLNIELNGSLLNVYTSGRLYYKDVLEIIRDYYEKHQLHITRMFGSYILIKGDKNSLTAIKATPIPIKYCPLMKKLLTEVGGETAEKLLSTLSNEDEVIQTKLMCDLINEVVIKGGYFDSNRPLNSCEANVLFGASETMSSAFKDNLIDAAVIVSNNLGTIITTNYSNTQGSVKRMTGLFYTSPSKDIMKTAYEAGIIPVFPYTAEIDQLEGVKKAISLGYKRIAVSVAADDNYLHDEISKLEKENNIIIYKFGLCSTGIDEKTATIMKDNADVIWSCASKQVKEYVEPNAIAQVGLKIPVHIMTKQGWEIIKNHLQRMNSDINYNEVKLARADDKPIFINDKDKIKLLVKKNISNCTDCPHPCI